MERTISSHCLFVSDLHGHRDRYQKLMETISREIPAAVFLGGDLLPAGAGDDFIHQFLQPGFTALHQRMGSEFPRIFVILGNDDPRILESNIRKAGAGGNWEYIHDRCVEWDSWRVFGYAFVPPTPFRLKDWERYDVSRFVDPGCTHPSEGVLTHSVPESELTFFTIQSGLRELAADLVPDRSIFLFHAPPYNTSLDRADLDDRFVDHAPVDVHVGSIAVRRFIEEYQPRLTLHGHVHETVKLTGKWKETLGKTVMLSAAHDGEELCLVRFSPENPGAAIRELI